MQSCKKQKEYYNMNWHFQKYTEPTNDLMKCLQWASINSHHHESNLQPQNQQETEICQNCTYVYLTGQRSSEGAYAALYRIFGHECI